MKDVPLIIKIVNIIKNFFKIIFLYIIKFFLIIFGLEDKDSKIKKEIVIVTENLKGEKKYIKDSDYNVPVDPSSLTTDVGNNPEELLKRKETIIYKHISNLENGNIRIFSITEEMIDRIIDTYIEEIEEVKIKEFDKELKEDYKDWKDEIIVPQVKKEFKKKYIKDENILKNCLIEILDVEIEIQHTKIDKLKEEKKEDSSFIIKNEKDKGNIIVDFKNELKPTVNELNENNIKDDNDDFISSKENIIIPPTPKTIVEECIEDKESEIKDNTLTLGDEINNIVFANALILNNIENILNEKEDESKKIKDVTKDYNDEKINDDIKKENHVEQINISTINELKEDNIINDNLIKETRIQPIPFIIKEEVKDDIKINIVKDDKIDSIEELEHEDIVQVEKVTKEVDGNLVKEEKIVIKQVDLPNIEINESVIENKVKDESYKEEFEDRDYDSLEKKVDDALEKIEMFIISNESKLSKQQLEQLNQEKEKLLCTKEKINKQRELDIEIERKALDDNIKRSELDGLQEELKRLHFEDKLKMSQLMINKLDDLNNMSKLQAREIEKRLLKMKLKDACRALSYSSLLALPFIRNKYFFFFGISLLVNRSLGFIGNIFRRHTPDYQEEELNNLIYGKDALNGAINTLKENIDYLNILEEQAKQRYPELYKDHEYLTYLNSLKYKLNTNYNRLIRRQNTVERLIYKTKSNVKILKRKKNKYYRNVV